MASTILCPDCLANTVQAPRWTFTDTTVVVPTCGCSATTSVEMRVSGLLDLEDLAEITRHASGLTALG